MNSRDSTKCVTIAALLGVFVAPSASAVGPFHFAHDGTLGSASTAVDILEYSCALTHSGSTLTAFEARVRDKLPVVTPYVRVKVERVSPFLSGAQKTDPNSNSAVGDGDAAGVASPFSNVAHVAGGTGVYRIHVSKSASGTELYSLDYHCLYGSTPHPAPGPLTYIQNQ